MKQLTILQAIQSKETFSPDVCNKENIGLEIQDFTEVALFQEAIDQGGLDYVL